jgi:2-oxo-3-hexenedioate decarboxylase
MPVGVNNGTEFEAAMTRVEAKSGIDDIVAEVVSASATGRQLQPFSGRYADFTFAEAYEVARRVRDIRVSDGEIAVGRKIGFTNRTVWDRYGLSAPIWGYMYDRTVSDLSPDARFALASLAEPRIEPEIVIQLAVPPHPDMSDDDMLECVAWVAHGFEIVQSIFPGWAFTAADAVAGQAVHVALLIGKRNSILLERQRWGEMLPSFRVELLRNGEVMSRGHGRDVLGGPIQALRYLVEELARDPASEPLRAGEIVTTGTLTQAMPVASGETWTTVLTGIDLPGLELRFDQ